MLQIFNKRKFVNQNGGLSAQAGMTYVELIVVLSIFAVISGVVMFDYGKFQDRIDVKNLLNDIALEVVEAQKNALAGRLHTGVSSTWKPAYGVYFDEGTSTNRQFSFFADMNNNQVYDTSDCSGGCMKTISMTRGNYISNLALIGTGTCTAPSTLSVVFTRPDASARVNTTPATTCTLTYSEITIASPRGVSGTIRIYPSGRVQIH